ncbi:hypothetical protein MHY87_01810 [Microvirga sp. ACRRW]|uniref:hypothetical protein n=1 Tax=Microvirga sp. ACRRW TaxID=2918205 RepID=UPI001EF49FBE|nr:hypothetical protein [Microvirga sp. ACRRW]MCG7391643.1 hypothetical protein [Microvirga sp. ACRRW]
MTTMQFKGEGFPGVAPVPTGDFPEPPLDSHDITPLAGYTASDPAWGDFVPADSFPKVAQLGTIRFWESADDFSFYLADVKVTLWADGKMKISFWECTDGADSHNVPPMEITLHRRTGSPIQVLPAVPWDISCLPKERYRYKEHNRNVGAAGAQAWRAFVPGMHCTAKACGRLKTGDN